MTHRTIKIDGTLFDIFDSQLGADHFKKRSEGGDISIILRNKFLFMRRGEVELTVRPAAGDTDDVRQKAAQAILDEAEAMIKLEMA